MTVAVLLAVLLGGRPFPLADRAAPPPAKRTVTTSSDLQRALCSLKPGERLRVGKGAYSGDFVIDGRCKSGTRAKPIQVVFDGEAFVDGSLTIRKSHWLISGMRIKGKGVDIGGGATGVAIVNSRLIRNRNGAIRVKNAKDVTISGNTIRDHGAIAAIAVEDAEVIRIVNNTLQDPAGGYAIDISKTDDVVIRSNEIAGHAVGLAVNGADGLVADHNHFQTAAADSTALALTSGTRITFANNVLEGHADAILVLGAWPSLTYIRVANNLVLGVSRTAFAIHDRAALLEFDFNVFSPRGASIEADMEGEIMPLARLLEEIMPNTKIATVMVMGRDLARISGINTVDRGTNVGLPFEGKAPDIGAAER